MPWKECSVMDERLRFVARLLEGDSMSEMCREFGISRKTGYKIFDRYKDHGLEALSDRSRRPVRYAEEREGPIMCVEHHLLRLARIGPDKHHAAMAETDVRDLHGRRHAIHHDDLVAPVKLVGVARRE